MGARRTPGYQRAMWEEFARDPEWSALLDGLAAGLPEGEPWPAEAVPR